MLTTHFRMALRSLRRHPAYSAINVAGLAVAMAVCLLVLLFTHDQASYDRFHTNADRIVRVVSDVRDPDEASALAASPAYVGPALQAQSPEVEAVVRIGQIRTDVILDGESVDMEGLYAEPSFFDLFDFDTVRGDGVAALAAPGQALLSEAAARRLFGDVDPVGQVITLEAEDTDVTVAGVVRTDGLDTHLRFDLLVAWSTLEGLDEGRRVLADEDNFWRFATYLLLRDGADGRATAHILDALSVRYTNPVIEMSLQPLADIALGEPRGNEIAAYSLPGSVAWVLGALALVVLLAAGFNYVGLATARATARAREVGVRKTIGAGWGQIVAQFLVESVVVTGTALVLAYGLLAALVPAFNGLNGMRKFEVSLSMADAFEPSLLATAVLFCGIVGLGAGLYPALVLARFRPTAVLKGAGTQYGPGGQVVRKALVVGQLALSLVLLISVSLLYRQYEFLAESDYGFRTDDVVHIPLAGNAYDVLQTEWLRDPDVLDVGATYEPPATGSIMGMGLVRAPGDTLKVTGYSVDAHYLDVLGLEMRAGVPPTDERPGVVLNESGVEALGLGSPQAALGAEVDLTRFDTPQPVVGVVQDYRFASAANVAGPLVLFHDPELFEWAAVRLRPGDRAAQMARLRAAWERADPVHPFEPVFLDDQLRGSATDALQDVLRVVGFLALIALTITCLGLLSMAATRAQSRTREVGIRKVLGASVAGLVVLLSTEFAVLVGIAVALGVPLAWALNQAWLNQFAYRVALGPGVFVLCIAVVLVLALLAVGSHAMRAATADPVRALRSE